MPEYERHEYDVLVIGAGGAGLRAAIEASAEGASVGVVCKSLLGKAHTVMAEGGMAASLANVDERDSWKVHFADTMRGGQYLNDWRMAEIHAKESPARVRELEEWGALFDRTDDGRILQRNFGGHAYPRLAHVGDRTGLELIRTLQDHGIHQGIDFHMEVTVTRLLKDGGSADGDGARVAGAFAYDRERGRFRVFRAGAVILATGGIGRAYAVSSNSWEYTGDGHTLALDAGAELMDMEFVQFHPTGMVWPPSVRGILVTEGVRGEGGVLRNSEGRRFLFDDIPEAYREQTADTEEEGWRYCQGDPEARRPPELLTRDHVARRILKEVAEGRGSPHGGAFLDIAWIKDQVPDGADHIKRKLPGMYHQFKELADIDITEEPMEVGPTTHYVMGGIRVDPESQMSTIPGLYAAGECASGLHGANRLGGNSLSDLVVFGRRAGAHAAEYAAEHGPARLDPEEIEAEAERLLRPFRRGSEGGPAGGGSSGEGSIPDNPMRIQQDLQAMMQEKAGIIREGPKLEEALRAIENLEKRTAEVSVPGNREYNPGWHAWIDLHNLLTVSEAVVRAAIERTESRGAQTRDDYPEKDPDWSGTNIVIRRAEDGAGGRDGGAVDGGDPGAAAGRRMVLERRSIPEMPDELKQIIEEQG
ncbi:MAG: fumarate reductase/succinate dehydrogenase flavoprotein subunit [Longimicrobiales bacterium]